MKCGYSTHSVNKLHSYKEQDIMSETWLDEIRFNDEGLSPAIAQDASTQAGKA